jgi:hypothetical protein
MGTKTIPAVVLCVFTGFSATLKRTKAFPNYYNSLWYAKLALMASGHCLLTLSSRDLSWDSVARVSIFG